MRKSAGESLGNRENQSCTYVIIDAWPDASARATSSRWDWADVVGVDLAKATDEGLYRVLEWGGMEVF